MKKIVLTAILALVILFSPLLTVVVAEEAEETMGGSLDFVAKEIGYSTERTAGYPLTYAVARGLTVFFGLLGILFLLITVYAGFRWMTAGGNEEQVTEAKNMLKNAVIGLAIVIFSYAITYFIGRSFATVGSPGYPF